MKNKVFLISLFFLLIVIQPVAWAIVKPAIMATNSPYPNGISDSCGGCVHPQVCQSGTCVTPTHSTDSSDCGASQVACGSNQVCISGSCVSSIDASNCYPSSVCTSGGTCGSNGQYGMCACSSGIINDNNNCGGCGNACTGSTAYCSYGHCIDANLCGDGGCAGTVCSGVTNIGDTCSDGNEYAGGDLEVSPTDLTDQSLGQAMGYCASLGAGWSLPTADQLRVIYNNNSNVKMSTSSNYWSSSHGDLLYSWDVSLTNGAFYNNGNGWTFSVRCVRSL